MPVKKLHPASVPPPACPCGSGAVYSACCAPLHQGVPAPSAEQLMRARYTAYVLHDNAFIVASWHPTTRPAMLETEPDRQTRWLGLEVKRHTESAELAGSAASAGSAGSAETATVEFVARFKTGGRAQRLHEVSRFVREAGLWWYVDGSFPKEEKQ